MSLCWNIFKPVLQKFLLLLLIMLPATAPGGSSGFYRRLPSVFLPLSGRHANNVSCVFAALPGCRVWMCGGKRPCRSADVNNIMGPIHHITLTSHGATVNLSGKWKHLILRDGVIVMLQQENPGTICWQCGLCNKLDFLIGACFLIISDHLLSLDY